MSSAVDPHDFGHLFSLQPAGPGYFVTAPPGQGFLFGGMTLGLTLRAAAATVHEGLHPKSLHVLFLNAGAWGPAVDLQVDTASDSRAFSTRRITADQQGRHLVIGTASFHVPEASEDWQVSAPDVPPPEALAPRGLLLGSGADPAELRPVLTSAPGFREIIHPYWARSRRPAPDGDAALRYCSLLFITDYMVIATPFPRGSGRGQAKLSRTLEHSIWFHRPVRDDDWLLYSCEAVSVAGGRYFSQGSVHDRAGRLIATFAQQGMIRPEPGA